MNNFLRDDAEKIRAFLPSTLAEAFDYQFNRIVESDLAPLYHQYQLARLAGISTSAIDDLIARPAKHYRLFRLPKRSGGTRTIRAPLPALRAVQTTILRYCLAPAAPHEDAHAYVPGKSIVTNAAAHLSSRDFLKVDLVDFFGRIKQPDVRAVFSRLGYSDEACSFLGTLCTIKEALPQGAPSSPHISNLHFLDTDLALSIYTRENHLIYTRYADDITISGAAISENQYREIVSIIQRGGFLVNINKTRLAKNPKRKIITGLSISDHRICIPKRMKRDIRREAHFLMRNGLQEELKFRGVFDPLLQERILGKLLFWAHIEPKALFPRNAIAILRRSTV